MAENSKIEWCHHTANGWWGCVEVHDGCDNCYARIFSNRYNNAGYGAGTLWGNSAPRKAIRSFFPDLLKFNASAKAANETHRVFVGSMMDIFEKPRPLVDHKGVAIEGHTADIRMQLFKNISAGLYPNLMFLLLTKRPSNINKMIPVEWKTTPPKNVMFGTSPVNQATFNGLVKQLQEVNGFRFLSVEPQLARINLGTLSGIDWIIQGGESGIRKRAFNIEWARQMRDECRELGIPYFFKQIDKVQPIPKDLRIREFPFTTTEII